MASIKGRDRMIASVNKLTGNSDCTEAVLLQERPAWWSWAFVLAAVVIGFVFGFFLDFTGILAGALIGLCAGLVYAAITEYWVVARCGPEVVVARSSKLSAKAVEIVERHAAPLDAQVSKGVIQSKVTFAGRKMVMARQFGKRFEAITSAA